MPIYSETISDKQLIRLVPENAKKVLIIGCGACMNESLAFKHNVPITDSVGEKIYRPSATINELSRIKELLEEHNRDVKILYSEDIDDFLCARDINQEKYRNSINYLPDIIMTLSCGAGYDNIRNIFPNVRVIKITKQTALFFYGFNDNDKVRTICKEKSALIPFESNRNKEIS